MVHKRAVLVGINYITNPQNSLRGCWNDVYNMREFLLKKGFAINDINILTDEPKNKGLPQYPTKSNIINAINIAIAKCENGDELYFHYSGHGGQYTDFNNDEPDGLDECIYDCNLKLLIDDDFKIFLIDSLPIGVKLRAIFDSCHSGSCLDLPYMYNPITGTNVPQSKKSTLKKIGKAFGSIKTIFSSNKTDDDEKAIIKDIIMISGCKDNQTSADAFIDNKSQGALTSNILKLTLKESVYRIKWKDFILMLDQQIKINGYNQIPMLSYYDANAPSYKFDL